MIFVELYVDDLIIVSSSKMLYEVKCALSERFEIGSAQVFSWNRDRPGLFKWEGVNAADQVR